MQLENDIKKLQKLPLFNGLDHEHLSMIAFSSERLLFQTGERMTKDGQLGHAAYLVLSGTAEMAEGEGNRRHVHLVGPGTLIGELAMLVEFTFSSNVTVIDETLVLELRREMIHDMMRQFPPIMEHLSHRIHSRLSNMAETMRRFDQRASFGVGESKLVV